MKRLALILLFAALISPAYRVSADGYNVEELRDENSAGSPPFSIARVIPYPGGLRLFLSIPSPDAVALLLTSGDSKLSSPITPPKPNLPSHCRWAKPSGVLRRVNRSISVTTNRSQLAGASHRLRLSTISKQVSPSAQTVTLPSVRILIFFG